jgi:hypothetical protein
VLYPRPFDHFPKTFWSSTMIFYSFFFFESYFDLITLGLRYIWSLA